MQKKSLDDTFNEGLKLHRNGAILEAKIHYENTLIINPNHFEALHLLGVIHAQQKSYLIAEKLISKSIEINPYSALAHSNLGNVFKDLNRFEEAISSYNISIKLKSNNSSAFFNRGVAQSALKNLDASKESYQTAIELNPKDFDAYINLGSIFLEEGDLSNALLNYDESILLNPSSAIAHYNRGNALLLQDKPLEALESYNKSFHLNPSQELLPGIKLHTQMRICKWIDLDFEIDQLHHSIINGLLSCPPFPLLSLIDDPDLHLKAAKIFNSNLYPEKENFLEFHQDSISNIVRIGYYSSDFFNHATSYLIAELLESHDFNKFEIYGFSYGPPINDEMNYRLKQNFTKFYDISCKSDRDVAILSRNLKIDIAIDLKGFTQNSRTGIFIERCAPIQVNYLGYPGSMASSSYDYIISDVNIIPEEYQKFYSESVIYMPHSYQVNDSKRHISEKIFQKSDFGLPDLGFIYCCFNNNYKITPDIFELWMRALREVPGSVLWLLEDNLVASQNLRIEADRSGVDSKRLIFSKRIKLEDHLARHKLADLFIDTFPYNAHTTASDALWSGLPVVTLTGKSFASRVAASLLYALNLSELVTFNHQDYLAKLIDLGNNPSKLMAIKEQIILINSTSPLFKGNVFARHIEDAYLKILKLHQSGHKPQHIFVRP